jgi:glycosyltransferase involved in cell wall biosynthesis
MCRALVRQHRPEAVITTSPPVCASFIGEYLKQKFGLPWIADYRDPSYANNPFRKVPIGKYHWEARLEMRTMRRADQITANTPIMLQGLHAAYPQHADKITLVTNGFDRDIVPLTPLPPVVNRELTIVHAGELYVGRDPRPIFEALAQLRQEHPDQRWRLRLLGQSYVGDLAGELRQRRLEDIVSIEGQVGFAQALKSIQDAHILMVLHTPGFKMTIPAKLYDYIAAGRPILALAEPDGDIAWVLKTAGVLHRIAPLRKNPSPVEAKGVVEQIKQALKELRCEIQAQPAPIHPTDQAERFTRHHMAELMAQCLDRCVPAPAPTRLTWSAVKQPC